MSNKFQFLLEQFRTKINLKLDKLKKNLYLGESTIVSSEIAANRDAEVETQLFQAQLTEDDDVQTIEELHVPGFQYKPHPESRGFYGRIAEAWKIFVGIDDKVTKETLVAGESIHYAYDSGGTIVCKTHYKVDGTIQIDTDLDLTINADGDLNATVSGDTILNSTGDVEITAPNVNITGNLNVTGDINADGDVIADAAATLISLINHYHQGNLGSPTGPSLMTGGGTSPSSPPSTDGTGNIDMNGNDVINIGGSALTFTGHKHAQGNDSGSDSEVDTDTPT